MKSDFRLAVEVVGSVVGVLVALTMLAMKITFWTENVPLRVFVDGRDVYHGRSACVSTESIGSSSRVDTRTGFACMFPKEYFAGKDVVILTERERGEK